MNLFYVLSYFLLINYERASYKMYGILLEKKKDYRNFVFYITIKNISQNRPYKIYE